MMRMWVDDLAVLKSRCWWTKKIEKCVAAVLMRVMSRWSAAELIEETYDVDLTVSFNCKIKLVLLLRLGYLKPFLAGSKKTRQGPGWRVGALCISRCWFYLTVVAGPQLIQKDYKITLCCVLLCYGSWWFKCYDMWIMKFMKWLWDWLNDELVVNRDKLRKVLILLYTDSPPLSVSNNWYQIRPSSRS